MSAAAGRAAQALAHGDNELALRGALTFDTAPDLLPAGAERLRTGSGPVTIDLAEVERIDSAGLALLVEWMSLARGREVRFVNVPAQARELMRVYGVSAALGLGPDD